jgi:hypothetical protein
MAVLRGNRGCPVRFRFRAPRARHRFLLLRFCDQASLRGEID